MIEAVTIPLVARRRRVFQHVITRVGYDWTAATFRAQVRQHPDTPGTANVTLATVTDNSEGIKLLYAGSLTVAGHIASGRLSGTGRGSIYNLENPATGQNYLAGDSIAVSQLRILIDNSTMASASIPPAPQVGDDLDMFWEMLITPSAEPEQVAFEGEFIVKGAVVQP